jgi:hypothetical protein
MGASHHDRKDDINKNRNSSKEPRHTPTTPIGNTKRKSTTFSLYNYAKTVVPLLNQRELRTVVDVLKLDVTKPAAVTTTITINRYHLNDNMDKNDMTCDRTDNNDRKDPEQNSSSPRRNGIDDATNSAGTGSSGSDTISSLKIVKLIEDQYNLNKQKQRQRQFYAVLLDGPSITFSDNRSSSSCKHSSLDERQEISLSETVRQQYKHSCLPTKTAGDVDINIDFIV